MNAPTQAAYSSTSILPTSVPQPQPSTYRYKVPTIQSDDVSKLKGKKIMGNGQQKSQWFLRLQWYISIVLKPRISLTTSPVTAMHLFLNVADTGTKKKICNWCKKHGFPCEGNLWFNAVARRLKEEQAKKRREGKKPKRPKSPRKTKPNLHTSL